jgi:hypothetical protein
MEPRVESLTVKVTTVPLATAALLPSRTVAETVDVPVILTVAGEGDTVIEDMSAMVTAVEAVAVPTVAVIVSLPTAEAVNVAVATPAVVVALAVILPIDVLLKEKSTVIPLPKALPALSVSVAVIVAVPVLAIAEALVVIATLGARIVIALVPDTVPTVAATVTLPSPRPVNVAVATPPVVWPLLIAVMEPREESLTVKVTTVPSAMAALLPSSTVAETVDVPVMLTVAGDGDTVIEDTSIMATVVEAVTVPTAAVIVSVPTAEAVNVAVACPLELVVALVVPVEIFFILPSEMSPSEKSTEMPAPRGLPPPSTTVAVMVDVPVVAIEGALGEITMPGFDIVTVVVFEIVPKVAVTVALPLTSVVELAVIEARDVLLNEKDTVAFCMGARLESRTVAVMVDACVRLIVVGEGDTVTDGGRMVITVVWATVPTVAVIVWLPDVPEVDVNVAVATPLEFVVALEVTLPRLVSLRVNITVMPAPNGLPA